MGEERAFVTSQIAKHNRYLDMIRERIRHGTLKLTAALAKMLGLPFNDGVELVPLKAIPATYSKSATVKMIEEGRAMAGLPESRVKTIAQSAAEQYARTGDMDAAMRSIAAAVRGTGTDPDTRLPRFPGRS